MAAHNQSPIIVRRSSHLRRLATKMTGILQDPRQVTVGGTTQQLLSEVTRAIDKINRHRPLPPQLAVRLRESLLPDRVVASLNMEGIVATRRQTLAVMDAMRVQESIGQGEREIYNALAADEFVNDAVERGVVLSEGLIRQINRLVLDGVRADAGQYRVGSVKLPGAPMAPPEGPAVAPLMTELVDCFPHSEGAHPVVQACWLHDQLTLVHPFNDGNGRTGRLLQDWALVRRGFLPVGIPPSQRDDYYAALERADRGSWDDLVELVGLIQLTMISKVEAIIDESQRRLNWVTRLAAAAATRQENTRHKQYIVWRKRVESVAQAFKVAALELDASSTVIGASLKDFGVIDYREWDSICRRGAGERSWLFSIIFFAEGRPFYKAVAYLKRHVPLARIDTFDPPRDAVAIYFTGAAVPDGGRPDFAWYEDPDVRLREVLIRDDAFVVYRQEKPGEDWQLSTSQSIGEVVEEFFTDIFERKAGLAS